MMPTREQVTEEALTWLDTPFEMNQSCKAAGVDCARFVNEVLRETGIIPEEGIGIFSGDFAVHLDDEVYMKRILRHAYKVAEAISSLTEGTKPGNIVLLKTGSGRIYDHAGIVIKWPMVIHACPGEKVRISDVRTHWLWANKEIVMFDPWEKKNGVRESIS